MSTFGVSGVSVNLGPDDVGARVSVRRRLLSGATDVVGDLEILDADGLAIRRPNGSLVSVAAAAVVAARVVGPSPLSARELEAVSGRSWPAPEESWLGRWWLRAAGGFTARANSVRPLGAAGVPFDDALAAVAGWYAERGLPPMIRVVKSSSADDELDRRGWSSQHETIVQTATVAGMRRRLANRPPGDNGSAGPTQLASLPTPPWLQRYRGGALAPAALSVLSGGGDIMFATIGTADAATAALAIGRAAVEVPWAGFAAIEVDPTARRRGHARAVLAALVDWAAMRGATRGYLEVLADNASALALYASLGFAEHHRYHYRQPSGAS